MFNKLYLSNSRHEFNEKYDNFTVFRLIIPNIKRHLYHLFISHSRYSVSTSLF